VDPLALDPEGGDHEEGGDATPPKPTGQVEDEPGERDGDQRCQQVGRLLEREGLGWPDGSLQEGRHQQERREHDGIGEKGCRQQVRPARWRRT
jgi:hypothetical protein